MVGNDGKRIEFFIHGRQREWQDFKNECCC